MSELAGTLLGVLTLVVLVAPVPIIVVPTYYRWLWWRKSLSKLIQRFQQLDDAGQVEALVAHFATLPEAEQEELMQLARELAEKRKAGSG